MFKCKQCNSEFYLEVNQTICEYCQQPLNCEKKNNQSVLGHQNNATLSSLNIKLIPKNAYNVLVLQIENMGEIKVQSGDIIGRSTIAKGSDILCNFPTVSREHIKVIKKNGNWYIENLSSSNGTYFSNEPAPIDREQLIESGDYFRLSKNCTIRVK